MGPEFILELIDQLHGRAEKLTSAAALNIDPESTLAMKAAALALRAQAEALRAATLKVYG